MSATTITRAIAGLALSLGFTSVALCSAPASHLIAPSPRATDQPRTLEAAPAQRFEFISGKRALSLVESGRTQIIDTRTIAKYLAGHIPGAIHLRDDTLRQTSGGMPVRMLDRAPLAELFAQAGIAADKPVLVYADGEDPLPATLVAYGLIKAGHNDVRVLDGGFTVWQGVGPSSQDFPAAAPASPWPQPAGPSPAATIDDVRQVLKRHESELIDARPAKLFRGETKAWKRNGHIPGAVNLDWHSLVLADNESLLRPRSEIDKLLSDAKLDSSDDTIVYCGTGREATLLFLTLRASPAWSRVRLFEGSWTEYQTHADLPVATGTDELVSILSDGEMSTCGQPTPATLTELAERGFKLVINCRSAGETRKLTFSEPRLVESLGMKYVEIPLGGSDGYSPEDVARLDTIIKSHGGTDGVLMHCSGGGRASTLWAAYLIKVRGEAPATVMTRVREAGMLSESSLERLIGEQLRYEPAAANTAPAVQAR